MVTKNREFSNKLEILFKKSISKTFGKKIIRRALAGVGRPLKCVSLLFKLKFASLYEEAIVIKKDK